MNFNNLENSKILLRLGTYNIRNITDHYHLRKELLKDTFKKMNCDIIGLQEISFLEYNQLDDLVPLKDENKVRNYKQFCGQSQINIKKLFPNKDFKFNIDGNAIMHRNIFEKEKNHHLCEDDYEILHLSAERIAQMIIYKFYNSDLRILFVNCHLHHVIQDEEVRVYQSNNIINWLKLRSNENDIIFIVGDFNALPNGEAYKCFIDSGYSSLYKVFHGKEPEQTFHNKMDAPFKDTDPEGTFDYIFFKIPKNFNVEFKSEDNEKKNSINFLSVELHGLEESSENKGIFPSDHYGLCCEFEIKLV